MKNEIVLYQSDELASRIEVRIEADTVWLNSGERIPSRLRRDGVSEQNT